MEEEDRYIAEAEMRGLCADIFKQIICRVQDKPLARMKCLSRGWHRFISRYPSAPPSTFFCQFMSPASQKRQVIIFDNSKREPGREFFEHDFTKIISPDYCLIGFSKTRLLIYSPENYIGIPFIYDQYETCPWTCPPPVVDREIRSYRVGMGVASDEFSNGYKVVAYVLDQQETSIGGRMEFEIYSPASMDITRTWKPQLSTVVNKSATVINLNNISSHIPCLFRKGMLNWILEDYILVYHVNKNVTKLIRLPDSNNNHKSIREQFTQKLWDWNGCMYYSNRHDDKIFIWSYDCGGLSEDAILNVKDDGNWGLIHMMELATLVTQHPEIFDSNREKSCTSFELYGFNGYIQILYAQLRGMVVCYSLESRRLIKAWTFEQSQKSVCSLGKEVLLHQSDSLK